MKGKKCRNVMEKDSNNKYIMSSEKMKYYYSEISPESFEPFKNLIDVSLRTNLK